ncbi:Sorbitol dehydrogenase [Dirofilaria immitis]
MVFLTPISTTIILVIVSLSFIFAYMRPNRCYSCMSPLYEELFKDGIMSRYFYEPRNFTSQCNEPMQPFNIGLVNCKSICLTLTQDFVVMGRNTGRKLTIRGCAVSISRHGFFNRTMVLFNKYDMCRDVKASDFFRYESDSQIVRVCSCLGDRCNISASYCVATPQFVVAAAIFLSFIPKLF